MQALGTIVAAALEGMLFGAGTLWFGVLAVTLGRGPVRAYRHMYTNHGLSYPAGAMCLVCVLLVVTWLLGTSGAAQVAVAIGAPTGFMFAVLGWRLLRWSVRN